MGGRTHEFLVTIQRNNASTPWGFSLVGGADVNTPLIVTKVAFGSPADGVLQRGDIISKIGSYDSRDIRHQDAQSLFKNAGDNVRVVVQREHNPRQNTSTGSSRSSSRNYSSPLSVSPHLSPRGGIAAPYSPAGSALTPAYGAPFEVLQEGLFSEIPDIRNARRKNKNLDVHVANQPYRTTPLVLPGAKVKPDQKITECYLRHHPNPTFRAHPHQADVERFLRQKVADSVLQRITTDDPTKQVVHKQFNSPIGLYSDSNIVDTLQRQTGAAVSRRPLKYDPSKSETYRALQEESLGDQVQEVQPPQSRVYTPNRVIPGKRVHNPGQYHQPQAQQQQNDFNSVGGPVENIQQSHSFKRLMWSVMPETDY